MNIYANPNSAFPSQTVSDAEKSSEEYGRQVAQAIEGEWWQQGGNVLDLLHLIIDTIH